MSSPTRWRPRRLDIALGAFFCVAWLIPIVIVGLLGSPPTRWPTWARDYYSISCLFEQRPQTHGVFYVQVQLAGEVGWRDFPEDRLFRLEPFGHRNRFDRFMVRFGWRPRDEFARAELANWLARRWPDVEPDSQPVVAVRYLRADIETGAEPPTCAWAKPARSKMQPLRQVGDIVIIGPHDEGSP